MGLLDPGSMNMGPIRATGSRRAGWSTATRSTTSRTSSISRRARARAEPRDLRARLPAARARVLAGGADAEGLDGEAVLQHRAGHSAGSRSGSRRPRRRSTRTSSCSTVRRPRVGGLGVGRRPGRHRHGRPRARTRRPPPPRPRVLRRRRHPDQRRAHRSDAVARCELTGRPVATPDEAAAILGLRPRG